ncbi:MAG: GNAT family N-acetyltransferase [Lachnospiraceae bacterium]|nr:GNAT family N-acetyltransferase [Candidatus Colinaster equi]
MSYYIKNGTEYVIREAQVAEWDAAMELAYRVFLRFEAEDYGEEGTYEFARFVTDPLLKKMFLCGNYKLFVAEMNGQIVGIVSLRNINHISLLFVEEKYHKNGIGRELMRYAYDFLKKETTYSCMTVNASPYGTEFYHKIGFEDTDVMIEKSGIRYTPMMCNII